MVPPHFFSIGSKTGGETKYVKNRKAMCLTEKQANHVYKKVGGGIINVHMLRKELEQDLDREDDSSYKRVVLNKVYKEEHKSPQVEDWSIFPDQIKYIHHNKKTKHKLELKPLDY